MKINLGEVLTKAWQIVWKFKVLWIFGILAGCAGSNRGNVNYNLNDNRFNQGQVPNFMQPFQNMNPGQAFNSFLAAYGVIIGGVLLLLCVLWLVFLFLGIIGRIGLIKGAGMADAGAEKLSFGELWSGSLPYFWRMFGMNLLIGLPFVILVIILIGGALAAGLFTYNSGAEGGGLAAIIVSLIGVFFGVLCLIGILGMIVGMIIEQAQNAIVLENLGVFQALGRGWNVFKNNFLTVLVVAIILGIIGWVVGFLIAIPAIAVAVPVAIGFAAGAANESRALIPMMIIAGGCFLLFLPVLLLFNGIILSYTQTVWTITYRRLTALPAQIVEPPAVPVQ